MTAPEQPPPEEEEGSSLIPALLAVYSAYLIYRAAQGQLEREWKSVVVSLGLPVLIGGVLAQIAARALARQQRDAGRAGDELWRHTEEGIAAGVTAGYQVIAEALIYQDQHAPLGGPATRDAGDPTGVPTAENPPWVMADMTANAVGNAAQTTAAAAAGWRYKTWVSMKDNRVRHTHRVMNGQRVGMQDSFTSPTGVRLEFPGDPSAPIEEIANCRCAIRIGR